MGHQYLYISIQNIVLNKKQRSLPTYLRFRNPVFRQFDNSEIPFPNCAFNIIKPHPNLPFRLFCHDHRLPPGVSRAPQSCTGAVTPGQGAYTAPQRPPCYTKRELRRQNTFHHSWWRHTDVIAGRALWQCGFRCVARLSDAHKTATPSQVTWNVQTKTQPFLEANAQLSGIPASVVQLCMCLKCICVCLCIVYASLLYAYKHKHN